MKNYLKPFFLLVIGICLSTFTYAGNDIRIIPVRSTPVPNPLPESERVPPRTFIQFILYYDQNNIEIEIQIVDEVNFLSYRIETFDGALIQSNSLGFIPEGASLFVSLVANPSNQYEIQLNCNYGEYYASLKLE